MSATISLPHKMSSSTIASTIIATHDPVAAVSGAIEADRKTSGIVTEFTERQQILTDIVRRVVSRLVFPSEVRNLIIMCIRVMEIS